MRFQDLLAYKKSFILSMEIFEISKKFPSEEKYSLTDQIRRSSRSISANIAEASRKIRYPKHLFQSYQTVTLKMQKHNHGWNMHLHVTTSQMKFLMI
jgi:23S rRNA-intervening sequence protein